MDLLSIVIPCYNEASNIPLIVDRLNSLIGNSKDIEVILVNNGSVDETASIMKQELAKSNNPNFKQVDIYENKGYGYGILEGLKSSKGSVLAWTHADMQTDPKDVLNAFKLFKVSQKNKVIIKGKRKNRKLLEAFFTWGMEAFAAIILGENLNDINAQPKLFSRKFYEQYLLNKAPFDFSLDLFLLHQARKNQYKILTIPVYFAERKHGESKGGGSWKTRIKLIKRTVKYILNLKKYK